MRPAAAEGAYDCPVYKTTARGSETSAAKGQTANFVCYVRLPTDVSEAHWIKRSAALICNLDD